MSIIPILFLHAAAAGCYFLNTRQTTHRFAIVAGIAAHLISLAWHLLPNLQLGLGVVLSGFFLLSVIAYRPKFLSTRRLFYCITAAAVFAPFFFPPQETTPPPTLHACLAIAAYAAAAAACFHWLDLRATEKLLRQSPQQNFSDALLNDEKRCFRTLLLAFILLTLTIISGFITEEALRLTHKNLFAILTWLTFFVLLAGRYLYGWRGKTAQLWLGCGFFFLLLSYAGSTFVIEVILR